MKMLKKNEGFTLIELMIVVVIIGVLAAVAVPQFLKYQLKSKSSEATRMVGAIKTASEAFSSKYACQGATQTGCYPVAAESAAFAPAAKVAYASSPGLELIGFTSSGLVYFSYSINTAAAIPATIDSFSVGGDCTAQGVVGNMTAAAGDSTIAIGATGVPEVVNGVQVDATTNVIAWAARGDVDGVNGDACYLMGNSANEFIPVPADAGDNSF